LIEQALLEARGVVCVDHFRARTTGDAMDRGRFAEKETAATLADHRPSRMIALRTESSSRVGSREQPRRLAIAKPKSQGLYPPTLAQIVYTVRRLIALESSGQAPTGTLGRKWAAFVGAAVGDTDDEQAVARGGRKLAHMTIAEDVRKVYLVACSVLRGTRDRDADPSAPIPNVHVLIRQMERRLKRVLRDWDRRNGLKRPRSHVDTIAAAMFRAGHPKNAPRFRDLRPDGEIALALVARKYGHPPGVIDRYAKEGRRFLKLPF